MTKRNMYSADVPTYYQIEAFAESAASFWNKSPQARLDNGLHAMVTAITFQVSLCSCDSFRNRGKVEGRKETKYVLFTPKERVV